MFRDLEKLIIAKLRLIETGKATTSETNINKWLNDMRKIDEPAYEELNERHQKAIRTRVAA